MKYLPKDLNPCVKDFALNVVFMEYQVACTNPTHYTDKGHCARNVELAVTLSAMLLFYWIPSIAFFLQI